VGLVEQEWLDTLGNINPEEVTFLDFIEAGRKLGAQLKQEVCFLCYLNVWEILYHVSY
jgi:5'-nucleotidase